MINTQLIPTTTTTIPNEFQIAILSNNDNYCVYFVLIGSESHQIGDVTDFSFSFFLLQISFF